jgi:hypothetical protein
LPATAANGCVPVVAGNPSLGPPSPRVAPRLLGHQVEVLFRFGRLPVSPACRPWVVTIGVYSGAKASSSYKNWVEQFRVLGRSGRVALNLPFGGAPPYRVIATSSTISGRRAREVEVRVACPGTRDVVRGCLRGDEPAANSFSMPKPVLRLRGIDRRTLAASFWQVLAGERTPPAVRAIPRSSRCLSLRLCEVTYVDPAFPRSPYRRRYSIAGQQVRGCWIGLRGRTLDPMPYQDAGYGRFLVAGCGSWLD